MCSDKHIRVEFTSLITVRERKREKEKRKREETRRWEERNVRNADLKKNMK